MSKAATASNVADFSGSRAGDGVKPNSPPEEKTIWNEDTLKKVSAFRETFNDIKEQRQALSDELSAAKSALIALGFNKDGLEAAIKYSNLEEKDRGNWDLTFLYVRRATGHPLQDDLFEAATRQQVEVYKQQSDEG